MRMTNLINVCAQCRQTGRKKFHVIQAKLIMSVWCFTVQCNAMPGGHAKHSQEGKCAENCVFINLPMSKLRNPTVLPRHDVTTSSCARDGCKGPGSVSAPQPLSLVLRGTQGREHPASICTTISTCQDNCTWCLCRLCWFPVYLYVM